MNDDDKVTNTKEDTRISEILTVVLRVMKQIINHRMKTTF